METAHIIQFSDTHLFADPGQVYGGVNTDQTLRRVVQQILDTETQIDAVIVTGDLVQEEVPAAYARFVSHLSRFSAPVYCIAGNHDLPAIIAQCLNIDRDWYVPEAMLGAWRFLFLNSHQPGKHAGFLPQSELQRLNAALLKDRSVPVLICLHHHPVPTGSPWMDGMALENPHELFAITDNHPQVKGIIWGHIHQAFSTTRKGVSLLGCPSTCAQFLPGATEYARDDLPPGYRRLVLDAAGRIDSTIIRVE